jgi:hypothetical protein
VGANSSGDVHIIQQHSHRFVCSQRALRCCHASSPAVGGETTSASSQNQNNAQCDIWDNSLVCQGPNKL